MATEQSNCDMGESYERIGETVSIYLRGRTWQLHYMQNGKQVRRSLQTRSKKEARRQALLIEKELLAGDHKLPQQPPSIKVVVDEYLEHLQAEGRAEKTINKYDFCFQLLLAVAEMAKVKRISQVDVRLVNKFRALRVKGDGEQRRPAKPKTVHNDTVCIRQLVNFALRCNLIHDDPLAQLRLKKPPRTPQPCWSREQVDRILGAAEPPHRAPLVFLAETGARVGEAKWLAWNDIDLDKRLVHIRPKDGWRPKSGDERAVPMSDSLHEMLANRPRREQWVFTARNTAKHPERGRQISERRLLEYLKRVLKRLGLKGHLHTFRHSFISFAAVQGIPERVLRKWIGHVDREVLDWYFHLADRESQAAMKRLSVAASSRAEAKVEDPVSAHFQHTLEDSENDKSAK